MANREQLRILKEEGVEAWNEWRQNNRGIKINLRGANLSRQNLGGADFSEADIRSTNFSASNLKGANFAGAKCGVQRRRVILQLILSCLRRAAEGAVVAGVLLLIVVVIGVVLVVLGEGAEGVIVVGVIVVLLVTVLGIARRVGKEEEFYVSFGIDIDEELYVSFGIAFDTIGGTSFCGANLTEANFTGARLKGTDLREATLTRTRWYRAKMLDRVRPGDTYLQDTQVRQWLIGKGTDKNFDGQDLRGVNLQGANLTDASFIGADLSEANLQDADLSRARLIKTRLDGTDLTGACIQDWHINIETNLENVICDYIYLKKDKQERRPSDPSKNFEPGEFAKLVQKSIETVDLIFSNGIDWQSFLKSFQNIQVENANGQLEIQAIERKTGGAFLVRVEVPLDTNKADIEASFWSKYQPLLEAKDKEIKLLSQQTEFYSQQIEVIRKDNTRLLGIVETMAEKETSKVNMTFNAPATGVAGNVEGDQNIYATEQKQTLAEAAAEIQQLLKQLEKTNPTATEAEKIEYVNNETSPGFKRRAASALKAGGETAIEEFLDNPYVNVGKAVVKGWMKPE